MEMTMDALIGIIGIIIFVGLIEVYVHMND
jgi:hypothetical protein